MTLDEISERLSVIIQFMDDTSENAVESFGRGMEEIFDLYAAVNEAMFDMMTNEEQAEARARARHFCDDGEDVPF